MSDERLQAYRLLIADVYELAGVSRRTSEAFARSAPAGAAGIRQTTARWHVMSVVSEDPATVPAIARRLGQRRQSVQRVVDALAAAGCVQPRDNPAHRRSPLIALTPKGRTLVQQLNAAAADVRVTQLATAGVTADDLTIARTVIRRLIQAIEEDG